MSANLFTQREFLNSSENFLKPLKNEKAESYYVNNKSVLYKYKSITFDTYKDYCKELQKSDFSHIKYDNPIYDVNAFFMNTNLIYTYYFKKEKLLRIIYEQKAILPDKALLENGSCELYQLSLDQKEVNCGMSYVIKLCDSSFFIIDGGYFSEGECDRLYKFLCERSNDKIIISGWFFSHAHEDHFGCFMNFAEQYSSCVKVENLYYNFPNMYIPECRNWKKTDIASTERFYEIVNEYLPNVPHIKLHSGQKFNVRNAEIEVLATHEDLYPNKFKNFNDTSTVIRIKVNGKSILFLGDTGDEMSKNLIHTYGENLRSDIVQVAHHGFNGAKKKVYKLVDAVTVLWPTADYCFDKNLKHRANKYLFKKSKTAREHIISGYGTKSIIL